MDFVLHDYTNYVRRMIWRPFPWLPAIRGLATWCVLLALLLSIFSKALVIADFYVNQDTIAKNLCLNRKNTAISCAGKCQLNRRLKQENKDNSSPERRADSKDETISAHSFYCSNFNPNQYSFIRRYPATPPVSPIDRPSTHFHPPDC
jgi:hypothetical protein